MPRVKLWNDNEYPFKQEFQEEMIKIEPKRFILMDHEKAILFKGTYYPPEYDGGNNAKPESFKKLRIEIIDDEKKEVPVIDSMRCVACNYIAISKEDLEKHVDDNHMYQLLDKDEIKRRQKKNEKPQINR